jgi:predicted XRE-type DNA-binding protein
MDRETLRELARANQRAQARSEATRGALIDAIWEAADQNGIPQVEIAKATGFTRERLRQLCRPEYRAAEMKRRADR